MREESKRCSASANSGEKSVTGTSSEILAANTNRKAVVITNCDAAAYVYIGVGFVPTTSSFTHKLAPAVSIQMDSVMFTEAFNAISSAGTVTVRVYEGV